MELWRELSAEPSAPEDQMVGAAAVAACALARGAPLPAGTAAGMRRGLPGLLSMGVRMPAEEGGQEEDGASPPTDGSQAGNRQHAPALSGQRQLHLDAGRESNGSGAATCASRGSASHGNTCTRPACCGGPGAGARRCPCTLRLPLSAPRGSSAGSAGSCVFTMDHPVSAGERQVLAGFCNHLGAELERARHHLAKQRLEVRAGQKAAMGRDASMRPWAGRCSEEGETMGSSCWPFSHDRCRQRMRFACCAA